MLHLVALVSIDVSEELIAFIIRVTRIGELGTTLATSVLTTATRRNLPVVAMLQVLYVAPYTSAPLR
jgi:hypothetical protein